MGETQAADLHVRNRRHMAWLRHSSLALFGAGLLLVVLGATTGLSATITLIGGLLIVAGVVKVATIRIWDAFFTELTDSAGAGGNSHE